jgi:hypothetical protein
MFINVELLIRPASVNVSGYYNIHLCNTHFGYLFYFSDMTATCFGPFNGPSSGNQNYQNVCCVDGHYNTLM